MVCSYDLLLVHLIGLMVVAFWAKDESLALVLNHCSTAHYGVHGSCSGRHLSGSSCAHQQR